MFNNGHRAILASFLFISLMVMAGCGGSGSDSNATINLSITDTPVDGVNSVVVAFTGIDLKGPDGQITIVFSNERTLDLLKLQGNVSAMLLNGVSVPAGDYQWLRLNVDLANSYLITSTGGKYPLQIPSGSQNGLKLVSGFTLAQGGIADFMIDFNLRQALTLDNSGGTATYTLKPALRLINMQQVGTITGSVPSSLNIGGSPITDSSCSPAVYAYLGGNVVPEGYYVTVSGGTMPLTSASVSLDNTTGTYTFTLGFLTPGTYTLAVTCAALDFNGATALAFSPDKIASVTAGNTTTVDF